MAARKKKLAVLLLKERFLCKLAGHISQLLLIRAALCTKAGILDGYC